MFLLLAARLMLKQSLTYMLASIAEKGISGATRIFQNRFGVDIYQLRVLRLIRAQPGITFTELTKVTKIERSATSRMVSQLIKGGLVKRTNSPNDARQFTLEITAAAEALCDEADPLSLELEAQMLAPLTPEQREAFRDTLDVLMKWADTGYSDWIRLRFPEADPMKDRAAS